MIVLLITIIIVIIVIINRNNCPTPKFYTNMPSSPITKKILILGDYFAHKGANIFSKMIQHYKSGVGIETKTIDTMNWDNESNNGPINDLIESSRSDILNADFIWFSYSLDLFFNIQLLTAEWRFPQHTIKNIKSRIKNLIQIAIDEIRSINPIATVVQFGYCELPLSKSGKCTDLGKNTVLSCVDKDNYIACWNNMYKTMIQDNLPSPNSRYVVLNLLGTLQSVAGNKKASPGNMDINSFAPDCFFPDSCLIPNESGYFYLFEEMYKQYWKNAL